MLLVGCSISPSLYAFQEQEKLEDQMQLQLSDPREEWTLQRRLEMHPLVPRELLILQHLLLQPITPSPALAPNPLGGIYPL